MAVKRKRGWEDRPWREVLGFGIFIVRKAAAQAGSQARPDVSRVLSDLADTMDQIKGSTLRGTGL